MPDDERQAVEPEAIQSGPVDILAVKATGRQKAKPKDDLNGKAKAHQRYYATLRDDKGEPVLDDKGKPKKVMVPGATTVLNTMSDGYLVAWANRLGLEGIDSNKYRDETADIGTLSHYLVECSLTGEIPNLEHFTPYQQERAAFAVANWREWSKGKEIVPTMTEGRLVSDTWRYGGTVDFYGTVDGVWTLLDFKTSENIYLKHRVQATSYARLLIEAGHRVQKVTVIRLGRGANDDLETHTLGADSMRRFYWPLFEHCLAIYRLQKQIKAAE